MSICNDTPKMPMKVGCFLEQMAAGAFFEATLPWTSLTPTQVPI
jgi:hypothetical protein